MTQSLTSPGELPALLGTSTARRAAVVGALLFVLVLMFVFELTKTFFLPRITLWESHSITIVFSSACGAIATWAALRWHDDLHGKLRAEEARRQTLETSSAHLAERASILEQYNRRLAGEIEERRRLETQLVHAQKMESIGRLAGGIAHDFNNLLMVIINGAELALMGLKRGSVIDDDLKAILHASTRAGDLTAQLLAFARHQPYAPAVVDIHTVLETSRTVLDRLVGARMRLHFSLEAGIDSVFGDVSNLEQVIYNLVVNAGDAMNGEGVVMIRTYTSDRIADVADARGYRDCDTIVVEVTDTGHGIPPEAMSRLFEPFFTTKSLGAGTGLGLATSYGIVMRAGGTIEGINNAEGGATFRVTLPVVQAPVRDPSNQPDLPHFEHAGTVLVVDDEPGVVQVARRTLEEHGYLVLVARDGEEALARARDHIWYHRPSGHGRCDASHGGSRARIGDTRPPGQHPCRVHVGLH